MVKLLPCDNKVMGSSPGNNLLQKCKKMLYIKPKVVGPFPRPCASWTYMHRAPPFF
jgi:hypothetical protein